MEMHADHLGRAARHVCLVALTLLVLSAWPPRATAQEDPGDQPRHDIRLGNTDNMRMGRNAQGDTVMEVRRPPKDPANQPRGRSVFYLSPGRHAARSPARSRGPVQILQPGTRFRGPIANNRPSPRLRRDQAPLLPASPGQGDKSATPSSTVRVRPAKWAIRSSTNRGQSGQIGNTVIYNPGQPGAPAGPGKGAGS